MHVHPFGPEEFRKEADIGPEVLDRLMHYHQLLLEWNPRINLVADSTLGDAWRRHFMDSAQLYPLVMAGLGAGGSLADLGSGAGFPGLVLAMMGVPNVTLVERDTRKAAFLRTVAAQTGTKIDLLNVPIEAIEGRAFDVITSRALAEIGPLLSLSKKLRKPSTICLFLKGKNLDAELANAQKEYRFSARRIRSITDPEGCIVRLADIGGLTG